MHDIMYIELNYFSFNMNKDKHLKDCLRFQIFGVGKQDSGKYKLFKFMHINKSTKFRFTMYMSSNLLGVTCT